MFGFRTTVTDSIKLSKSNNLLLIGAHWKLIRQFLLRLMYGRNFQLS